MSAEFPGPELSIILPTRNECSLIAALVEELFAAFPSVGSHLELVIVDASDDGTWEVLEQLSRDDPRIRPLRQQSTGFSPALGEGLLAARGQWVLCMNADGNHRPADAYALFARRRPATLIVGSRFVPGGGTEESYLRFVLSKLTARLVQLLSGIPLRDPFSSFFVLARQDIPREHIPGYFQGDGEGMLRMARGLVGKTFAIEEMAVRYGLRRGGESKTDLLRFLHRYLAAAIEPRRSSGRWFALALYPLPLFLFVALVARNPETLTLWQAHPERILWAILGLAAAAICRGWRWSVLCGEGLAMASWWRSSRDIIAGRYWNEALPLRLGELVRMERIHRREALPWERIAAVIALEKLLGISVGLVGAAALLGLAGYADHEGLSPLQEGVQCALALAFCLGTTVVGWMSLRGLMGFAQGVATRALDWSRLGAELRQVELRLTAPFWVMTIRFGALAAKAQNVAENVWRAWSDLSATRTVAALSASLGIWGFSALSLIQLARVYGLDDVRATVLASAAFAAGVTTQIRILPGAAGQSELTQVLILTQFGMELETALMLATAYVLAMRGCNIAMELGCRAVESLRQRQGH